jgi:hypothetical protein
VPGSGCSRNTGVEGVVLEKIRVQKVGAITSFSFELDN